MKYDILEEQTSGSLQNRVSDKISEGWEPLGGVSFVYDGLHWWYAQAMILTDKAEKRIEAEKPE